MTQAAVVADANVLLDALLDAADQGDAARKALTGYTIAGPEHLQIETFQVIWRLLLANAVGQQAAQSAVTHLGQLQIQTIPTPLLLERMWQLRENLTGYDAAYVATAEYLDIDLLTRDSGIHAAPGVMCTVSYP